MNNIVLSLPSKVIYPQDATILTATVDTDTVLKRAKFKYWINNLPSSAVEVPMTISKNSASVNLLTIFNDYELDDIEFIYQVITSYDKTTTESNTAITTITTDTITDSSDEQSVIFRNEPVAV